MPKRKRRFTLLCVAALAVLTVTHHDALADDPLIAFAQRWDSDRNGIYTCSEWKLFMRRLFAKADKDRDGFIEAPEFRIISGADPVFSETSLAFFDADGDGKIARRELIDRESPFFLRYDADHDCQVTMPEIMR